MKSKNENFPIRRNFSRHISPSNSNKSEPEIGWFSISHNFINEKENRRKMYSKWFCLKSGNNKIYRQLKFDPTLNSTDNPQITIDWQGFIELHGYEVKSDFKEIDCEIRPANSIECIIANFNHPNQGLRAAYQISLLSLFIGVISLLISIF
jgi:hypothetical protein